MVLTLQKIEFIVFLIDRYKDCEQNAYFISSSTLFLYCSPIQLIGNNC